MKLLDFAPVVLPTDFEVTTAEDLMKAAKAAHVDREATARTHKLVNDYKAKEEILKANKEAHARRNDARAKLLWNTGGLPEEFRTKRDALTKAAESPRISTKDVRRLADELSFAVFPYEYMHPKATEGESREIRGAVRTFGKELSQWFDTYVLGPAHYYSPNQHVEATTDLPIYAGPGLAPAFAAVGMTIPLFRGMRSGIAALDQRTKGTEGRLKTLTTEVRNLERRVNDIEEQVRVQREQAIIREAEMREELARISAESRLIEWEPMMLAVPKGGSIMSGDVQAIVGPCWGPDFEEIVVKALGYAVSEKAKEAWEAVKGWTDGAAAAMTYCHSCRTDHHRMDQCSPHAPRRSYMGNMGRQF